MNPEQVWIHAQTFHKIKSGPNMKGGKTHEVSSLAKKLLAIFFWQNASIFSSRN